MTTAAEAIRKALAGGLDWLVAVFDQGETYECGLCGDRERGFESYNDAYRAARAHLTKEHLAGLVDLLDAEASGVLDDDQLGQVVEVLGADDERCQPIGCDNGYHLPGCSLIAVDADPVAERLAAIEAEVAENPGPIVRDPVKPCRWFLACPNPATGYRSHSILGEVPVCDRCSVDPWSPASARSS